MRARGRLALIMAPARPIYGRPPDAKPKAA